MREIKVTHRDGTEHSVKAYKTECPQLFAHKVVGGDTRPRFARWRVTHEPTGLAVFTCDRREQCYAYAARMVALGADFDFSDPKRKPSDETIAANKDATSYAYACESSRKLRDKEVTS